MDRNGRKGEGKSKAKYATAAAGKHACAEEGDSHENTHPPHYTCTRWQGGQRGSSPRGKKRTHAGKEKEKEGICSEGVWWCWGNGRAFSFSLSRNPADDDEIHHFVRHCQGGRPFYLLLCSLLLFLSSPLWA